VKTQEPWGIVLGATVVVVLFAVLSTFLDSTNRAERELEGVKSSLQRFEVALARGQQNQAQQELTLLAASPVWGVLVTLKALDYGQITPLLKDGTGIDSVYDRLSAFVDHQRGVYTVLQQLVFGALVTVILLVVAMGWFHKGRQESEALLRQVHQESLRTLEAERRSLSRDLHDTVAQDLAAVKMQLSQAPLAETSAARIHGLLDSALAQVRHLAEGLRPPSLDSLSFRDSLAQLCETTAARSPVVIEYSIPRSLPGKLDESTTINVYRIVQEALNNVVKHAQGDHAQVLVSAGATLQITITDNGVGLPPSKAGTDKRAQKLGLIGMRERATLIGATLEVDFHPGQGTQVVLEVPLEDPHR
jgi:signal transduction histidine kinase